MTRYLNYLLSLILFLLLLKYAIDFINKKIDLIDNYKWELIVSCPKFYAADNYQVSLLNKKKNGYAFVNSDDIEEWGGLSTDIDSNNIGYKYVPDSIIVNWNCRVDMLSYELKTKLPREKILQLFKNPLKKEDGSIISYNKIVVGMAPGGNVTVWMRAVNVLTEIAKFKAVNKGIWQENDKEFKTSKEFVNSECNIFHYLHGIPYSVWEKGEKEYNYDVGFTSESNDIKNLIITSHIKEGSWYQSFTGKESESTIELFKWDDFRFIENNNLVKKVKLPVQLSVSWRNITDDVVLNGEVLMPQNLEKLMNESYLDNITGKSEHYNRIIIGAYKGGGRGVVWLTGKNKKTKLLEFVLDDIENKNIKNHILYSIPKGFKFPKWEGREKLIQPDVEFWQEE